jgi:hypothetical protein
VSLILVLILCLPLF